MRRPFCPESVHQEGHGPLYAFGTLSFVPCIDVIIWTRWRAAPCKKPAPVMPERFEEPSPHQSRLEWLQKRRPVKQNWVCVRVCCNWFLLLMLCLLVRVLAVIVCLSVHPSICHPNRCQMQVG